jgi:hypothetical protein
VAAGFSGTTCSVISQSDKGEEGFFGLPVQLVSSNSYIALHTKKEKHLSIPDFQTLMLPVLRIAATGEVKISDVVENLADEFALSAEDRSHLLPSGKQTTFLIS